MKKNNYRGMSIRLSRVLAIYERFSSKSFNMHSVNAAFRTDLFIRTNKDPKFCFIWARKHSVATSL